MRLQTNLFVLSAACLSLALVGPGCDNSTVNESSPPAGTGSTAPPKDAPPPPTSVKEFYERTKKDAPSPKGSPAAKPAAKNG